VYLANARSGRVYPVAWVSTSEMRSPKPLFGLRGLVLNERGFLGWEAAGPGGSSTINVHDTRGNRRVDSAPGRFSHLALVGNLLSWWLDGDRRSRILR